MLSRSSCVHVPHLHDVSLYADDHDAEEIPRHARQRGDVIRHLALIEPPVAFIGLQHQFTNPLGVRKMPG